MTDKLDKYRSELREIAAEAAEAKAADKRRVTRRTAVVSRARKAGMTWREAATLLDMTEHGLIKSATPSTTTKTAQKSPPEPATDEPVS